MLYSDKYGFTVACPTKTGTNSMRAIVEKWKRRGGDIRVLQLLTGEESTRHRIAPPPGREDYRSYMMVRDPFDRAASMYEYLRRKPWEWMATYILDSEERYGRKQAWVNLLKMISEIRDTPLYQYGEARKAHGIRPYMWTDTLSEMAERYRIDEFIKLEEVEDEWEALLVAHEVEEPELWECMPSHRNASPEDGRLFADRAGYWKVRGVRDFPYVSALLEDSVYLGYGSRKPWATYG